MSRPAISDIQIPDSPSLSPTALMRVQRQANLALRFLYGLPLGHDQAFLTAVAIGTVDTNVTHGLDRIPAGWLVTRLYGNATVFQVNTATITAIPLRASAAVVADIIVF